MTRDVMGRKVANHETLNYCDVVWSNCTTSEAKRLDTFFNFFSFYFVGAFGVACG